MHLYKIILVIIFCLLTITGISQEKEKSIKLAITGELAIITKPTTNIGFQPGVQVGFSHWALLSEAAFPMHNNDHLFTITFYAV
jgi:hypothetical protein